MCTKFSSEKRTSSSPLRFLETILPNGSYLQGMPLQMSKLNPTHKTSGFIFMWIACFPDSAQLILVLMPFLLLEFSVRRDWE